MVTPTAPTELGVNVFTAPGKTVVGERPKPFGPPLGWDPITSTLIYGEYDAVLVDPLTTVAEANAVADWVGLHHRNLTTIYITHGHFDHFFGLSVLLDRFPDAKAIATPRSVELINRTDPELARFFAGLFPGQFPAKIVLPEPYDGDTFTLEGHELRIIEQGRTDTVDSTSLHVPSIDLVVGGDVLYNECHMFVGDTTPESRRTGSPRWIGWPRSTRRSPSPVTRRPVRPTHPRPSRVPKAICGTSGGSRSPRSPIRNSMTRWQISTRAG
jgi:glyoxylase-like metal-dependent hydrolase (beta-lactamase superfamily II)